MTDRTLTAAENPSGLSPLVEAVRLENAIKRKRRQVEKLATKLQDAEFERVVFEQALERVRKPLVEVVAPVPVPPPEASQARQVGGVPVVLLGASDHDAGEWEETTLRKAYAFDSDEPCLVRRQSKGGDHATGQGKPGTDSSVGVAATAEDGHEAPAQNRQPVEPPSDPATGTTRREPPETAIGGSTGAVTDSGGSGAATSTGGGNASEAATQPESAGSSRRGDPARFEGPIDMTGRVLGDLTVVSRRPNTGGAATWSCRCVCGRTCVELGGQLRHRAKDPKLRHLLACSTCRDERRAKRRAEAEERRAQERGPHRCAICREPGHNSATCPSDPSNATRQTAMGRPEKVRPRNGDCPKCFSMPSRVEGPRCPVCRLEAEKPPRATDYTSGESPLGRAV